MAAPKWLRDPDERYPVSGEGFEEIYNFGASSDSDFRSTRENDPPRVFPAMETRRPMDRLRPSTVIEPVHEITPFLIPDGYTFSVYRYDWTSILE